MPLNRHGAVNAQTREVVVVEDARIDATTTIALFRRIEAQYPAAETIDVFADSARYCSAVNYAGHLFNHELGLGLGCVIT